MRKFSTAAYCLLAATSITCAQPSFGSLGQGTGDQSELNDRQSAPDTSEIFGAAIDLLIEKVRATFNSDAQASSRWSSNASPRDTVFTFLESMNLSLYKGEDIDSQISKTLPEGYHSRSPEVIALKSVFDRLGTLHPSDFPSKNSTVTQHIESYEVFPYAIDHEWVWRWLDAPPDGTITLEKLNDAHWRFTEKTIRGAPALLESMRSIPPVYANTGSDIARNVFLPSFDETPWWGWIIAAIGLLGSFYLGRGSRRLMIRFGDRYEARTKPLIGAFYRSISTSVSIIMGTLLFVFACTFIELSLAGKETAQNLFGAISIFVNRPFVVGDWVEFQGELGEVVDVRMQATHIRLLAGEMLIVPNMQFISKQVENLAMRKYIRREMDIAIPYATEPDKVDQAVELIDDVLRSDEVVNEGKCKAEESTI